MDKLANKNLEYGENVKTVQTVQTQTDSPPISTDQTPTTEPMEEASQAQASCAKKPIKDKSAKNLDASDSKVPKAEKKSAKKGNQKKMSNKKDPDDAPLSTWVPKATTAAKPTKVPKCITRVRFSVEKVDESELALFSNDDEEDDVRDDNKAKQPEK